MPARKAGLVSGWSRSRRADTRRSRGAATHSSRFMVGSSIGSPAGWSSGRGGPNRPIVRARARYCSSRWAPCEPSGSRHSRDEIRPGSIRTRRRGRVGYRQFRVPRPGGGLETNPWVIDLPRMALDPGWATRCAIMLLNLDLHSCFSSCSRGDTNWKASPGPTGISQLFWRRPILTCSNVDYYLWRSASVIYR
jgi:hypothetical protein